MIFADFSLSLEPAWPWSIPTIGLPAMLTLALMLTFLTVWTYLGVQKITWIRLGIVLLLRLLALALTFCMMMRPSFAVTNLEGVETSKLLLVFDDSESMNEDDLPDKLTRWKQVQNVWSSSKVKRRLEQLAAEQKIEVVSYLAAEGLRAGEPGGDATGKRTNIAAWLDQMKEKHEHEKKQLRGFLLFSDGGDNGSQSPQEKALSWRGICPIHTLGAGDGKNAKFARSIALTRVQIEPSPVPVNDKMLVKVFVQATGIPQTTANVTVVMENVKPKTEKALPIVVKENVPVILKQAKEQKKSSREQEIALTATAPEQDGEYKVTVTMKWQFDEKNPGDKLESEISTYVQVIKKNIDVLWVDRPRVYEPTLAIRALGQDKRFRVHYFEPTESIKDPVAWYWYPLDKKDKEGNQGKQNYDVIVVGDISAKQACFDRPEVLEKIKELVQKKGVGLLMLGGTETFGRGGWNALPEWMKMMPVTFVAKGNEKKQPTAEMEIHLSSEGLKMPCLQLLPDEKKNRELWKTSLSSVENLPSLGTLVPTCTELARRKNDELVMAEGRSGIGRVVVFGHDSTYKDWLTPETPGVHSRFWKQLMLYLANQDKGDNFLALDLDRRQMSAGANDILRFTATLRGKSGADLSSKAQFEAWIKPPNQPKESFKPDFRTEEGLQRGVFRGAKEPGEYQLIIKATAKDLDGSDVIDEASAHFVAEEIEKSRRTTDHELLSKLAAATEGRFHAADEQSMLQLLDELKNQVNGESRTRTTRWPDWNRVPSSEQMRDQLAGVWSSFSLIALALFVLLLGGEWFLRRWWGLV